MGNKRDSKTRKKYKLITGAAAIVGLTAVGTTVKADVQVKSEAPAIQPDATVATSAATTVAEVTSAAVSAAVSAVPASSIAATGVLSDATAPLSSAAVSSETGSSATSEGAVASSEASSSSPASSESSAASSSSAESSASSSAPSSSSANSSAASSSADKPKPAPAKPNVPKPEPTPQVQAPTQNDNVNYYYQAPAALPDYQASTAYVSASQTTDGARKFNSINISVPPVTHINNATVESFLKSIAPRVAQLAYQNNLYASIILAQAILESGYGNSNIATQYHNLFNIIGAYKGQYVSVTSGVYRAYPSYDTSLVDYINLMLHGTTWNSKIYQGSWKSVSKNYEDAAHSLQGIFATDPEYAAKLIEIIQEYHLTKYDDVKNLPTAMKTSKAAISPLLEGKPADATFPDYNGVEYPGSSSYGFGQCTQYVYNRILQLGGKIGQYMGNGGDWGANAVKMGYYTTTLPQKGYAVSFPPGVAGADANYGHVAFVEKVYKDGSILVSEMNVKGLNVTDYRHISASDASLSTYIRPNK